MLKLAKGLSTGEIRQRARLFAAQGLRADAAADLAELARRGDPQDRLAYAIERADAGDASTARELFAGLTSATPPDDPAIIAAARFLADQDGPKAAIELLERSGSDSAARARAEILEKHGDIPAAEAVLKARLTTADAWFDLAQFYVRQRAPQEAASAVSGGLKLSSADPKLLWLRGALELQTGDAIAGRTDLQVALSSPAVSTDVKLIAKAYQDHPPGGDPAALTSALLQVARKHPTSYLAWRELANAQAQAGDIDAAVQSAGAAVEALPADPRAAQLATEVLLSADKLDAASRMARRWRELIPAKPLPADIAQARIEYKRRDFKAAVSILEPHRDTLIASSGVDPEALGLFAASLAGSGRSPEAAALLRGLPESSSDWKVRYLRVTESLLPDHDAARRWITAVAVSPQDAPVAQLVAAQAWLQIGNASQNHQDWSESARLSRLALNGPGLRGAASALLGSALQAQGDGTGAVEAYRIAAQELPDSPGILNNLAFAILTSNPSEEAVTIARRAVALADAQRVPRSARLAYADTLGQALASLARFEDAARAYLAGLSIDGSDLKLLVGLAEAQLALGDTRKFTTTMAKIEDARASGADAGLRSRVASLRVKFEAMPDSHN
jgi:predicted Zn-dependent protease